MKLKKLLLLQLILFFILTIMVACERSKETQLDAVQKTEKNPEKTKDTNYSASSTTL